MKLNFYLADPHFGHKNIISYDKRPFFSVAEMNRELVSNWNSVVKNDDRVYILGDFCWGKEPDWLEILSKLRGKKVLIKGNHDLTNPSVKLKAYFEDIRDYKEIDDNGRRVIMSHYPIPFYKKSYTPNTYMLCGHVHTTRENEELDELIKSLRANASVCDEHGEITNLGQIYNVGVMMPWINYTPRTLDEIIMAEKLWRETAARYTDA